MNEKLYPPLTPTFFPEWPSTPPVLIPPVYIPPVEPPCDEEVDEDCKEPPTEPPVDVAEPDIAFLFILGGMLFWLGRRKNELAG